MSSGELREARINEGAITPKTPIRSRGKISPAMLISLTDNFLAPDLELSAMPARNPGIL